MSQAGQPPAAKSPRPTGVGRARLDPVVMIEQRQKQLRLPLSGWLIPFAAIGGIASLFFALSVCLDALGSIGSNRFTLSGLADALLTQDIEQARNTLGSLGEVMAAVLGLALTVSSIIVQLAATRFTPIVTSLFFRARTNLLVLGFFVVCNVFVLWVNFSVGSDSLPRSGVFLSMMLLTASLLLLFPYFAFVFNFLEPDSIISRITTNGLAASTPYRGRATPVGTRQREATQAVEHLANIGLNAVQQKDKNIASSSTNALCSYAIYYGDTKAGMIQAWHAIPDWNRQSPDFVSLSDEAIEDLRARGTWLEWKILRQYQMLYGEGLERMKDLCYLIAINTRRLGEAAARHGDLPALDLAIKFFNTYLRATINANDIRTCYNILHQYRQLGEFVIEHSETDPSDLILDEPVSMTSTMTLGVGRPAGDLRELEQRGLDIARYMRYYSGIAFGRGMVFITEVIAHDVGSMCMKGFHTKSEYHLELLETFLRVDDSAESGSSETTLRGVRRAQVKLACTYLLNASESYARRIQADMKNEPAERLRGIWQELAALRTREFWEVNDRGSNFDFLTDEQKAQLPVFFSWFPVIAKEAVDAMKAGKIEPPDAKPLIVNAP